MPEQRLNCTTFVQYHAAERFLESFVTAKPMPHFVAARHAAPHPHPFGLERIRSFLKALGNPQRQLKCIHIVGTSGKTSTTYCTAALLQSQGYRTGMVTSPHLATFLEYFTINGDRPSVADLLALIDEVKPVVDREYEQSGLGMISYAELVLSLAFLYFARQQVDYVALEAFLGGAHDATNVIDRAVVSILTNIGLDHTHILGNTCEEIAMEKVGMMKPGCPFLTAEQRPELLRIFQAAAEKNATTVERLGQEFRVEQVRGTFMDTVFDYISQQHTYRDLRLSIGGAYQAVNAALAIRAVELAAERNAHPLDANALRHALSTLQIPGRCEQVATDPVVILDAAHNPDKITQFVAHLQRQFRPGGVIFVCAFTSGKNPAEMLAPLLTMSQTFYLTRAIIGYREDEEPLYLKSVLTGLSEGVKAIIALDPFVALDMAMGAARQTGKTVCVTGSAYLVGYVRERWFPEATMGLI